MRAGMTPAWLEVERKVIGISLGADFCAEHEWGMKGLKRRLGIDGAVKGGFNSSKEKPKYTKPAGLPRRMISKHDSVRLYENAGAVALICYDQYWHDDFQAGVAKEGMANTFKKRLPGDLHQSSDLSAAWGEGSFGIYGTGANADRIRELAAAFEANNVAMWIGGRAIAFENGGLVLCFADRIPAENAKMLEDADLDRERLSAASEATGIIERLEAAKRGYFACSPKWMTGFNPQGISPKSAHPVIYWLNPQEQDQNNDGWYTVEELDLWIKGKGPIPMKEAVKSKG